SGHDLRLALLLVRATKQSPEFQGLPLINIDGVWERLMGLFRLRVGDTNRFREHYEVLTVSIDVGIAEDVAGELAVLASQLKKNLKISATQHVAPPIVGSA